VSDVKQLAVANGIDLLDRLHGTLEKFKKEESETLRRLRERRYAGQRSASEALEGADRLLAEQTAAAEETYAAEKARLSEIHDGRRVRIRALVNTGIRNLPRRSREEGERWLGGLQMGHFTTSRRLQSEREVAEARHGELQGALASHDVVLRALERKAKDYFLGYPGFVAALRAAPTPAETTRELDGLFGDFETSMATAQARLAEFRGILLPKIFSVAPLWAVIPIILLFAFLFLHSSHGWLLPSLVGGVAAAVLVALHMRGRNQAKEPARELARAIADARGLLAACRAAESESYTRKIERIEVESSTMNTDVESKWERAEEIKSTFEQREKNRFEKRGPRAMERNDHMGKARREKLDATHALRLERVRAEADALRGKAETQNESTSATLAAEEQEAWSVIESRWHSEITPLYAAVAEMNAVADAAFPPWTPDYVDNWRPQIDFLPATKFASLDVDIAQSAGSKLALPEPEQLSIPLALAYPGCGSILFEVDGPVGASVIACLNQVILRLLATTPPGKLSFTIIDPVGLGQNFAGLMHLGDYEESLISRRIWTQSDQIEARLAELNQHIEKIIQMYLRDEYPTIVEYNAQAGSTAEKYHFLVVADFPANFSDTAIKRLQSIITSGPRCGVYTLIHWDKRQSMPSGFVADELRLNSVCIQGSRSGLVLESGHTAVNARLVLDPAPTTDVAIEFIEKVGTSSTEANQVQVPFEAISPTELWKGDTTNELRVAIGRTGATKQQMFAVGKGTRQHALLAGKTGSGKSTLFHVLITNLSLTCSPEQVEFYLIDFKKGVEFKCYAEKKLPHAKVIAIESDREFGLSVLQRVDDELRRRGDIFRKLGVQDVAGYKRVTSEGKGSAEPMPRTMLIIDEFQELFVEDDSIAQSASVLLDRIVRQGRAFGIHVLLGSQTLGGAYSLARATLGQMVVRIALQCNEADSYLIMDDNNPAPRLLSRPGEGIYNDSAGAMEGNSPFQVCWLPESERDQCLDKIRAEAERHPKMDATPIVFEGNAPADIAENALLAHVLKTPATKAPSAARAWIGAPNSIKGPTELVFHRQSGSNLLVVGQRDEAALAMLGNSLLALAAQYPAGSAKFVFLHSAPPGSADLEFIEGVVESAAHPVTIATGHHLEEVMKDLTAEFKRRADGEPGPELYVFIHGLQRFKKLRHEDDFDFSMGGDDAPAKPGAQFADLVSEGATSGIHVLASLDTLSSVNRYFSRKAIGEFEMRVVFQMSANDSASLIDTPKAGNLGLHRALYYNEREGSLETFRPYAMPGATWLASPASPAVTPA
jgi:S-DNA-T family DNA segregation ATPase FtsK/SpoIIIE